MRYEIYHNSKDSSFKKIPLIKNNQQQTESEEVLKLLFVI
jgi:hypothetical protein